MSRRRLAKQLENLKWVYWDEDQWHYLLDCIYDCYAVSKNKQDPKYVSSKKLLEGALKNLENSPGKTTLATGLILNTLSDYASQVLIQLIDNVNTSPVYGCIELYFNSKTFDATIHLFGSPVPLGSVP